MTIRERIAAADQDLRGLLTAPQRPVLDRAMLRLGRAADHGVLWIAAAASLGATRSKWTRRAALRGLAGVALSSTTMS
jgi:hypothetical protein